MSTATSLPQSERIGGSYRDPSGYVFTRGGEVYRAIDDQCFQTLETLYARGLLRKLIEQRLLVPTHVVEDRHLAAVLRTEHPGFGHFLRHERIFPVTYPYEWSSTMLGDAALLTLDLEMALIDQGFSLKDATAFNVQFRLGRPIFIDLASIEQPTRLDVWPALGQFNRMFLYPLLLAKYRHWDIRSYFLSHLDGRDAESVVRCFGRIGRWRPQLLLDLTIPWLLERYTARSKTLSREMVQSPSANREPLLLNLRRMRRKISKLTNSIRPNGLWSQYQRLCNYDTQAEAAKKDFVRDILAEAKPTRVIDLGCNTGDYSLIAAEGGAKVIATDQDPAVVDILYQRIRKSGQDVIPLVIDITNPSPALGLQHREREAFHQRIKGDCVLALALLHHLLVSGNLCLTAACELLADITEQYLLLEFVPPEDDMFRRLARFRDVNLNDVTLANCRCVFQRRFAILREQPLPHSRRVLLWMKKRSG